jgi:hypothetical protein
MSFENDNLEEKDFSERTTAEEIETKKTFYINALRRFINPTKEEPYTFELPPMPEGPDPLATIQTEEYRKMIAEKYGDKRDEFGKKIINTETGKPDDSGRYWLFRPNNWVQFLIFFNGLLEDNILKLTKDEKQVVLDNMHAIRSINGTPKDVIIDGKVVTTTYEPKKKLMTPKDMETIKESI